MANCYNNLFLRGKLCDIKVKLQCKFVYLVVVMEDKKCIMFVWIELKIIVHKLEFVYLKVMM